MLDATWICIPAYKARTSLRRLLPELSEYTPPERVLVVDDGSGDGTASLCQHARVACLALPHNQGKGAALRAGFARLLAQDAQWIITMDADRQHAPADLPSFFRAIESAPDAGIIIGARSRRPGSMPAARILSNSLTSWGLSLLTGCRIVDSQSGYRAYSARFLRGAALHHERFALESEAILRACAAGFPVTFIPVQTLYCSHQSHIAHIRDTLRWIRAVCSVWLECCRARRENSPPRMHSL
jgi:glycosyltransferase involved in cell wall biosynthesis